MGKKVLLAPLDPVHDIGLKMIARGLEQAGHETVLLPPDSTPEEIVEFVFRQQGADTLLLSRDLGYGVGELLAKFIDLADAAGIRENVKIDIGGMAIRQELAAELGFDAGFGPGTTVDEVICFVEGREYRPDPNRTQKTKVDMTAGYDYSYGHSAISQKLGRISDMILDWVKDKTSPGVERARLRHELWDVTKWRNREGDGDLYKYYAPLCSEIPQQYYATGKLHPKTRRFTKDEITTTKGSRFM